MGIADRAWFHRAYPRALRAWMPLRDVLEGVTTSYPTLERPVVAARAGARRALGFDRQPSSAVGMPRMQNLPSWLAFEWHDMRDIEPDVMPAYLDTARVPVYRYDFESPVIDAYERLCAMTPSGTTHVVLVPWLRTGGADLEALNYVRALTELEQVGQVVVLGTVDVRSPWISRLPRGSRFIDLASLAKGLSPQEQEYLLATYLVQLRPSVVHNINSDLGYRVLVRHARALRASGVRLFASVFCFDYTEAGLYDGYQVRYLRDLAPSLDGIFCDNAQHLAELQQLFALDPDTLHVHHQPMESTPLNAGAVRGRRGSRARLRVLWAGRLDRQKRPDLLLEVARRAQGLPLEIDVYGDFVLDARGSLLEQMRATRNLTYRGSFDGLASLPLSLYDVLLYTSQWDGMPNLLLEATSHGLPIIAADVGGISEFVQDGITGRLVTPYDNVQRYVSCLADACRYPNRLDDLRDAARSLMQERHSFARFVAVVSEVRGYAEVRSDA